MGRPGRSAQRALWLEAAAAEVRRDLLSELPDTVAVAFSFPSRGARSNAKGQTLGECHHGGMEGSDETHLVLVHPRQWTEPLEVLHVLAHELCHVVAGPEAGHRGPFKTVAERIGLEGPMTATVPGDRFREWAEAAIERLPEFPTGALDLRGTQKKQKTRMRLYHCGREPPIKVRAARDNLDATCNECGRDFEKQETEK